MDFNTVSGKLVPRGPVEVEENFGYKDNSFTGSGRRSEDKMVNEEEKLDFLL